MLYLNVRLVMLVIFCVNAVKGEIKLLILLGGPWKSSKGLWESPNPTLKTTGLVSQRQTI